MALDTSVNFFTGKAIAPPVASPVSKPQPTQPSKFSVMDPQQYDEAKYQSPEGGLYLPSNITDPSSGKPELAYENPQAQASQLLGDRTFPSFDPTKAQKMDKSMLQNGRMPESVSQSIKAKFPGSAASELDHVMPLELGGSNEKSNLRLEPGQDMGQPYSAASNPTATDPLENQLSQDVYSGKISLVDAWKQMAKAKNITLPEEGGAVPSSQNIQPNQQDYQMEWEKGLPANMDAGQKAMAFFPSTMKTLSELQVDPASIKVDPSKAIQDGWNTIKNSVIDEFKNIKDMFSAPDAAGKVGAGEKSVAGFANAALSPISALFSAANDIPAIGTLSRLVSLPFIFMGDSGNTVAKGIVKSLPISTDAKNKIVDGMGQIIGLAGQIALGGATAKDALPGLTDKFGEKDANAIADKAQELAQEKTQAGQVREKTVNQEIVKPKGSTPQVDERTASVLEELKTAQAGQRTIVRPKGYEEQGYAVSEPSTFPDWIPSRLRDSKLLNQVVNLYESGNEPKPGTKAAELYDVVSEQAARQDFTVEGIFGDPPRLADISRAGFASPKGFIDSIREDFQNAKQAGEDAKYGEKLRTLMVGERNYRIALANQKAADWGGMISDPVEREALTLMRDFKSNPGRLRAIWDGTDPIYDGMGPTEKLEALKRIKALTPVIEKALNPTDAMKEIDGQMTYYMKLALDEGKQLGFLDSSMNPDEYISHLLYPKEDMESVKVGSGGLVRGGKVSRFTPFAKSRYYPTILDAVVNGVTPKTMDAIDSFSIYWDKHATAASTRMMINFLKDNDAAAWGTKNSDNVPKDWVELAPQSNKFRNTIPFIGEEGKPQVAYQTLWVPKKISDALRPITDADFTSLLPGFKGGRMYQSYMKAMQLGLSIFHVRAMNLTALGNEGLMDLVRSYQSDFNDPVFLENERNFVKAGGTTPILGKTIEAYRSLDNPSSIPTRMDLIREMPILKQIDQIAGKVSHFTFDFTQRKFKVTDFSLKDADWIASHPDATEAEHFDAQRSIAKEVNAAYGGLNWEIMGVNKPTLNLVKFLLLAPDWTFSNLLNAKYAFGGGPAGSASRVFWLRSAAIGLAMTYGLSKLLSGQNPKNPAYVYMGKDKNGKDIEQNIFFAGAPGDAVNLIGNVSDYGPVSGFAQTLFGKLNPIFRSAIEVGTNRNYLGQTISAKGLNPLAQTARSTIQIAQDVAPIPFSIQNLANMFYDPNRQYTEQEYVTMLLAGTRPRHVVPPGERVVTSGKNKGKVEPVKKKKSPKSLQQQIITGTP